MRKSAAWRGSPIATSKNEFTDLLKVIRPSKRDVFYDLGAGYARPCIWIAPRVELCVGFENHFDRYKRAKAAVQKSGFKNIQIRYADFTRASYHKATIIYSVVDIGLHVAARINRHSRPGTKLIQYWRPNYPIKGKRISGNYFLMKTPFERVRDENEFAITVLGDRATIDDLNTKTGKEDRRRLKREIRESESAWNRLFVRTSPKRS